MGASRRSEAHSMLVLVLVFGTDTLVFVVEHLSTGADGRLLLASAHAVVDQVFLAYTGVLLVVELLGMITSGRGRLATALAVVDEVLGTFASVLVEIELLGMSALRSADTVLVGLETVFLAFTVTLIVPLLVGVAFRYAFVVKHLEFVVVTDAFLLVLAIGRVFGALRLGMRHVAPPVLVDAAFGATDAIHVGGSVRATPSVALAVVRRTSHGLVASSVSVGTVRTFVDLVITSRLATGRVLLETEGEDVEASEVEVEVQAGKVAHAAHVDSVFLGPAARE